MALHVCFMLVVNKGYVRYRAKVTHVFLEEKAVDFETI